MFVRPELNLNKHPKDVPNGSLVKATNMMVHKDSFLLCTENVINVAKIQDVLIKKLHNPNNYNIVHICPCNKELVIFTIEDNDNTKLHIYRYNEDVNDIYYYGEYDNYNSEILHSTFTYNKDKLIIALAEKSSKSPLKVINLDSWNNRDKNEFTKSIHSPVCPKVIIPTCTTEYVDGASFKGWYYIFIRYKVSNNNYTQWFNTNESIFLDSSNQNHIEDYYIAPEHECKYYANPNFKSPIIYTNQSWREVSEIYNKKFGLLNYIRTEVTTYVSDNTDYAKKSFECKFNNLDANYDNYQIGFIIVRKDSTKCFRTNDISIIKSNYVFDKNNIIEESGEIMTKTYNNYYNVKTIDSYNNTLYIANYEERYNEIQLKQDIKNISVTIKGNKANVSNYLDNFNSYNLHNNWFNLFIHFIDEYGAITSGYPLIDFNTVKTNIKHDIIGDKYLINSEDYDTFSLSISNIPNNYVGYFVSYEELTISKKYTGIFSREKDNDLRHFRVFTQKLNVDETINLNFNKAVFYSYKTGEKIDEVGLGITKIIDKRLLAADSFNNICLPTCIEITTNIDFRPPYITNDDVYVVELINDYYGDFYEKKNKILIPASSISYNINNITVNTHTGFYTFELCLDFIQAYYNEATFDFKRTYNEVTNVSPTWLYNTGMIDKGAICTPFKDYKINIIDTLPTSSWIFNNAPDIIAFPIEGLNDSSDEGINKYYAFGKLTRLKDTVDLFKQPNVTHWEHYPKVLTNYDKDSIYVNIFPKTIRRSNIIADESEHIGWRFFEANNYKNIIENKGDIIKLSSIGNIMLVHTEHSLFQFNADTNLQSDNAGQVSIGNADIWDLKYREVLTSELGYAGINKEHHAVIGQFGYVFYEQDKDRFFRYDNNSLKQIDLDINNYIRSMNHIDVRFTVDEYRNRIIIKLGKKDAEYITYNYATNKFVSSHLYTFDIGYCTKNNIYLVDNDNVINTFNNNKYVDIADCSILINPAYEENKVLEYIKYRLNKITNDIRDSWYSGEKLAVITEECNTGYIDIIVDKDKANSVLYPEKPYRELGNWNINNFRNNIVNYPNKLSDVLSRIYGNYFIVAFCFTNTLQNKCVEVESIDCKFVSNLT